MSRFDTLTASLVRSPFHRLLGRWSVLLEYVGPRSGRPISLVVYALPDGDDWIVGVGRHGEKRWFRAFRQPLAATLSVGSVRYDVSGRLLSGADRQAANAERPTRLKRQARRPIGRGRPREGASTWTCHRRSSLTRNGRPGSAG